MRHLAAAIDTSNIEMSSNGEQQQHSAVYRCNGVFLACFQTTHIWGNLVSSLLLSHELIQPGDAAGQAGTRLAHEQYNEIYSAADGTGAYCGTYDTCDSLQPATSLTNVNTSGTCVLFTRDSICYSAYMISPVRLSVRPSVTRMDQSKTVEVRIMHFSPHSSPIPVVLRDKKGKGRALVIAPLSRHIQKF